MKIKKGEILKITHNRKGTFLAKADRDFDTEKEEFYPVIVLDEVKGLASIWKKGEYVACRSNHCSIEKEK